MIILPPLLFLAGSPGPLELLVIFAAVLVLFGPRKLPEIARFLGRILGELRKASEEFRSQVMSIGEGVGEDSATASPDHGGAGDDPADVVQDHASEAYDDVEPRTPDLPGESASEPVGNTGIEKTEDTRDDDRH